MKRLVSISMLLAGSVMLMTGCTDRETKKKIAELESRLDKLEGSKSTAGAQIMDSKAVASAVPANTIEPAKEEKPEGPLPKAVFETTDHDFGSVNEGAKVSYTYKVRNTGEAPLIIQGAQPSCGCTVPDWTKDPIPVGGSGYVKAEFDTNGKSGVQNKTITVTANTWPKTQMLTFKAMVLAKSESVGPVK